MELSIAVCVKPVPKEETAQRITIDPATKSLVRSGAEHVLNRPDKHALEAAISLKEQHGGTVDVFAMAPPQMDICLREALAMGADKAFLLSDRAFAGSDSLATARILAAAIKGQGPYDLLLTGTHSSDSGTAQVPAEIAELLGLAHLHRVCGLELTEDALLVSCQQDGLLQNWQARLPLLLSIHESHNKPRYTTVRGIMKAQKKPLEILDNTALALNTSLIGLDGSPSKPGPLHAFSASRDGRLAEGKPADLAEQLLAQLAKAGIPLNVG